MSQENVEIVRRHRRRQPRGTASRCRRLIRPEVQWDRPAALERRSCGHGAGELAWRSCFTPLAPGELTSHLFAGPGESADEAAFHGQVTGVAAPTCGLVFGDRLIFTVVLLVVVGRRPHRSSPARGLPSPWIDRAIGKPCESRCFGSSKPSVVESPPAAGLSG